MASVEKYTDSSVCNMLRHNSRQIQNNSNHDIDKSRSGLNYAFPLDHGKLSDYQYYKELLKNNYLYGRGTKREKEAVTACGWVVTLPRELNGKPEKESTFFSGVFSFVSDRYGKENIISNSIHYDEAGQPHIHILFCPVTRLDHDVVQHKTAKTKQTVRLPSGRYEYAYRFRLDKNGERIRLRNYARSSDLFDTKIDCNSVLNPAELRHFHPDLQKYLDEHNIEGRVITGKTGGINFSTKELKDFTQKTGLRLDTVRELQGDKALLESYIKQAEKVQELQHEIRHYKEQNIRLEKERGLAVSQPHAPGRRDGDIKIEHGWEHSSAGWGSHASSGWGKEKTVEEERTW